MTRSFLPLLSFTCAVWLIATTSHAQLSLVKELDFYSAIPTAVGNRICFMTSDQTKLWSSDGTESGTSIIKVLPYYGFYDSTVLNNILYFSVTDSNNYLDLWSSDGTAAGTQIVLDAKYVSTASSIQKVYHLASVKGNLLFEASYGRNTLETQLWTRTILGDAMLANFGTSGSPSLQFIGTGADITYFLVLKSNTTALYKTDGTALGTSKVKDIVVANVGSMKTHFVFNDILYFFADFEADGDDLWRSDGTEAGTYKLKSFPGNDTPYSDAKEGLFAESNGSIFFAAGDAAHGIELWKTDGTANGTVLVKDAEPGTEGTSPNNLMSKDGVIFYAAAISTSHGYGNENWREEFWRSDGTEAGTVRVKLLSNEFSYHPYVYNAFQHNNYLYFYFASSGLPALWRSDGTAGGTTLVENIVPSFTLKAGGSLFIHGRINPDPKAYLYKLDDVVPGPEIYVGYYGNKLTDGQGSIEFGTTLSTYPSSKDVTINSTGTTSLTGLTITKDGANPGDFTVDPLGVTSLAPGTSKTFGVKFTPAGVGPRSATLHIASNDSDESPFDIHLTGTGAPPPPKKPVAKTLAASNLTATSATLNGSVDPGNGSTLVTFTYGLTPETRIIVDAAQSPLSGTGFQPVSVNLTGLLPHKSYHYWVAASNSTDSTLDVEKTFVTSNSPPVAMTDNSMVLPGTAVTINVLGNDSDADADALTITKITPPLASAGTAKIVAGKIVFTAAATFAGTSFTYTISDGFKGTATGTVNVGLADCSLSPASNAVPAAATSYPVTVTTAGAWIVSEALPWASVSGPGTGNGTVTVTLLANTTKVARSGIITIGGRQHIIQQAGTLGFTIAGPESVPTGMVSADYSLAIPSLTPPVKFVMSGHPTGLMIHPATGVISGKPQQSGTFKVIVTGSTTAGASTTVNFPLTVQPLPAGAVGTFQGPIVRETTLNAGLGGRFELTTTAAGTLTGKIIMGATPYVFPATAKLNATVGGASPTVSFLIDRKAPLPDLTVSFTLDSANHVIANGDIFDGTQHATFQAWRKKWGTVMTQGEKDDLNHYLGLHTFALKAPTGQPALPQGAGYGSFTVAAATGALTASGRLADNTVFTSASFAGPNGEVLVYQALYNNKGSIVGSLDITPGTAVFTPPYGDNTLSGTVSWLRPAIAGRLYASGVGPYDLTAVGGRYVPPAPVTSIVMGITDNLSSNNARLVFSGAEIVNVSPDIAFRLKAKSAFATPAINPRRTTLTVTPGSGYFTGGFTLSDPNAIVVTAIRPSTYFGQIVRDIDGALRGFGFFHLADLPAVTGDTVLKTRQQAGLVVLEKNP